MARSRSPLLTGLGALVLAGLALTGCSTAAGGPTVATTPRPVITSDPDLGAAWLDNGRMIGLVTLGSSTCVPIASTPTVDKDGVLEVTLLQPDEKQPCTHDLVPRATLVSVPQEVDPALALDIKVSGANNYHGEVELPGVAGLYSGGSTDYNPSAGWATAPGQFVILTWGSSTCIPVIQDVKATGATQVTVTFAAQEEAKLCTADMAPQAQVTAVNGLEQSTGITATLTGGGFNNVKIPIYGSSS